MLCSEPIQRKAATFVLALNKAHVLALNTAHVLRLNKADVLALNVAHVLRLTNKICPMVTANTNSNFAKAKRPLSAEQQFRDCSVKTASSH